MRKYEEKFETEENSPNFETSPTKQGLNPNSYHKNIIRLLPTSFPVFDK